MAKNITSANSVFTLIIPGIYPIPVQLQGWAPDDAFDVEAVETAVVTMGVDGFQSAGWVPNSTPMTLHFQADSPSITIFETWDATETSQREKYPATGLITTPSVKKSWVLSTGILQNVIRIPPGRRTLQPQQFRLMWETILLQPLV